MSRLAITAALAAPTAPAGAADTVTDHELFTNDMHVPRQVNMYADTGNEIYASLRGKPDRQ